jgi:hypothetical protein
MKKFFRRFAAKLVTMYYRRMYRKGVEACDKMHENKRAAYYLIDWPDGSGKRVLRPISRNGFRALKHWAQGFYFGVDMKYWSQDYNMKTLREGAWYFTPDRAENNGLSAKEKEIRRLAFLREGLRRANLLDE